MIQRFLFMALKDGVEQMTADPTLIEQLFSDLYELGDIEVDAIKTFFEAKPPKVIHGYAPRNVEMPVYSIIMPGERESATFLNNDAPQITDSEDIDFGADVKTSIWSHTYHVLTYTEHPDVTSYYYEIAKSILLAAGDFFTEQGLFDITMSGQDLAPDPRYMPEHAFARVLVFGCEREFLRIDRESAKGKAFKVGGIHIDKSGSPSDVGGVKTLVTPIDSTELGTEPTVILDD